MMIDLELKMIVGNHFTVYKDEQAKTLYQIQNVLDLLYLGCEKNFLLYGLHNQFLMSVSNESSC